MTDEYKNQGQEQPEEQETSGAAPSEPEAASREEAGAGGSGQAEDSPEHREGNAGQSRQEETTPPEQPPYGRTPPPGQGSYYAPGWDRNRAGYGPNYYSGQQNYQYPGQWRTDGYRPAGRQPYEWNFDQMHGAASAGKGPGKKRKGLRVFLAILCAVAVVFVAVFAGYGMYVAATGEILQSPGSDGGSMMPAPSSPNSLPDITVSDKPYVTGGSNPDGTLTNQEIFKKCSPTVVGVVGYMGSSGFLNAQVSEGSGIVMSEDGYILTNAHVVSDPGITNVEVVLTNGENYPAVIVGMDTQTDIAVLKTNLTGLSYAEFGNSDQLEVGERVIAIGNPGGLRFASSLTVGYVSALNRTILAGDAGYSMETIQTDAAINPGNSGGPLINGFGQVVGINSAKYNDPDFEGMGFAIPINTALPIAQDLIANGRVTGRAMLGITAQAVTATYAEQYGIPLGLQIVEVQPGSDIAAKGVKAGDILTHINGTPIYSFDASAAALNAYAPGDTVEITIFRRDSMGRDSTFNLDIILTGG